MNIRILTLVLCLAATASCAPGADAAPEILVDRTACSHCGMLISEPVYAGAYRPDTADARVFDDLACLREAAHKEEGLDEGNVKVWVHDATTGEWIDARTAAFVSSKAIRTPMGGGVLAYRDAAEAARAAAKHGGRALTFADFMSEGIVP